MNIVDYISSFFKRVEAVPEQYPSVDDLVDGRAFAIKHYPLTHPVNVAPKDTLTASISEHGKKIAEFVEPINMTMTIDTCSVFRFNDALGYKCGVGAIFGQRN
jgi:hypothetical protein